MRLHPWIAMLALLAAAAPAAQSQAQSQSDMQPNPSFYLVNRSGMAIRGVFATPVGMPNWGRNRLAASIVPGGNAPVRLPADGACVYDLRVAYADGRTEDQRSLNLCDVDSVSVPVGRTAPATRARQAEQDPSFVLVNRSRSSLNELYLSATGDDSWGEDRLGDDTVPGGRTRMVSLPPGECLFDVRAVFANGEATEKRRLNLCQTSNLRIP